MDIKANLDAREQTGLDAQLAWYNAANPLDPLTAEGYVERHWIRPQLRALADRYDPATTDSMEVVRAAIKADPARVKAAIEAKEAEVAAAQAAAAAEPELP